MWRILFALWDTGFRLKCPVCEQGDLFVTTFTLHKVCPHCSVRFERNTGEEVGGMTISIVATCIIFLLAYMVMEIHTNWSIWTHFAIWIPFAILFPIVFYRYSRALWLVFLYLAGDIYWDTETYRDSNLTIVDAFFNRQNGEGEVTDTNTADDEPDGDKTPYA